METLKSLIEQHPDWADLPIVIYSGGNGDYDWIGATGMVYTNETSDDPDADMEDPNTKKITVLVFAI